jgi:type II secretory pathway component PulK
MRGYVLLSTLAVLVLAAVVLSGMIRSSLARIVLAGQAQDELQRRWGVISCQRALLPHAEQILSRFEAAQRKPVPTYRTQLQLGRYRFVVTLGDEQAKFNVNEGLRHRHMIEVEQAIRDALRGSGLSGKVRLVVPGTLNPCPVGSFAQILPDVPPARLMQGVGTAAPSDVVTCWSDGQINVQRASEAALVAALRPKLSGTQVADLVRNRQKLLEAPAEAQASDGAGDGTESKAESAKPIVTLQRIRQSLALEGEQEQGVLDLLTDQSHCHSLWVASGRDGDERGWTYQFMVLDNSDSGHPRRWSLAW